MAMDFVTRWFNKLVLNGAFRLPFADMKPCLLYADDALFFVKPEVQQIQMLKIVFTAFEEISGLSVNLHKSELIVSTDIDRVGERLAVMMGCKSGSFPMTYLGLPLSDRILKREAYLPLIHKLNERLAGWAAKHLLIARRLVLLNAVLSAIPVYYMSCFKLPCWVVAEIDKIRRGFLWHGVSQDAKKKMNLANWDIVCTPRKLGGLGVIDIKTFNVALLIKWYWKWVQSEMNLCKPLLMQLGLREDLIPTTVLFTTTVQSVVPFWSISIERVLGNNMIISFWHHNWGWGILRNRWADLHSFTFTGTITLAHALNVRPLQAMFRQCLTTTAQSQL